MYFKQFGKKDLLFRKGHAIRVIKVISKSGGKICLLGTLFARMFFIGTSFYLMPVCVPGPEQTIWVQMAHVPTVLPTRHIHNFF